MVVLEVAAAKLERQVLQVVDVVLVARESDAQLRGVRRVVGDLDFVPALLHLENDASNLRVEVVLCLVI